MNVPATPGMPAIVTVTTVKELREGPTPWASSSGRRTCGSSPARSKAIPPVADSGRKITREFCPNCGAPLFTRAEKLPDSVFLKAGSLDEPELVKPKDVPRSCPDRLVFFSLLISLRPSLAPLTGNLRAEPRRRPGRRGLESFLQLAAVLGIRQVRKVVPVGGYRHQGLLRGVQPCDTRAAGHIQGRPGDRGILPVQSQEPVPQLHNAISHPALICVYHDACQRPEFLAVLRVADRRAQQLAESVVLHGAGRQCGRTAPGTGRR